MRCTLLPCLYFVFLHVCRIFMINGPFLQLQFMMCNLIGCLQILTPCRCLMLLLLSYMRWGPQFFFLPLFRTFVSPTGLALLREWFHVSGNITSLKHFSIVHVFNHADCSCTAFLFFMMQIFFFTCTEAQSLNMLESWMFIFQVPNEMQPQFAVDVMVQFGLPRWIFHTKGSCIAGCNMASLVQ
jgi:hypothetical protein